MIALVTAWAAAGVDDLFQFGDDVRGEHDGQAVFGYAGHQPAQHVLPGQRVEAGQRLVQQQEPGTAGERHGEGQLGYTHLALTGPADGVDDLYDQAEIVTAQRAGRQALVLARTGAAPPGWAARPVTMQELVLGYLREPAARAGPEPGLEIVR